MKWLGTRSGLIVWVSHLLFRHLKAATMKLTDKRTGVWSNETKQTVDLCLEKKFWCDYWHMELVGSKYIKSLLSVRELCCQINHESAFKKLLTFWDLQLLGPQCSMRKKVAEKKSVQLPRSPCFPLPTSKVPKRITEKKEHLGGKSLQSWSTSGAQPLSRLSTEAASRNTHHRRERGDFITAGCPQSSPFQVKMCAMTILPLSTNVYPTEVGRP